MLPRSYATERRAWLGVLQPATKKLLRVEAAADGGRVVFFAVLTESDPADASAMANADLRRWFMRLVRQASLFLVVLVAAPMAWRNTKMDAATGEAPAVWRLSSSSCV